MTPFEMAYIIHNRDNPDQALDDFVLKTFGTENVVALSAALALCIGWERAFVEIKKLISALSKTGWAPGATFRMAIAASRSAGYDPELEATLARRWRCPHCKQFSTIENIRIHVSDPKRLPSCTTCGEEGVAPVETTPTLRAHRGGRPLPAPPAPEEEGK